VTAHADGRDFPGHFHVWRAVAGSGDGQRFTLPVESEAKLQPVDLMRSSTPAGIRFA